MTRLSQYIEEWEERLKTMTLEEKEKHIAQLTAEMQLTREMMAEGGVRDYQKWAEKEATS